jgi:hypothetical protein
MSEAQPVSEAELAFLTTEYEQLIARDGVHLQTIVTIVGVAAPILGALSFGLAPYDKTAEGLESNILVYIGLPLAPTILLGVLLFLTLNINFMAQYSHAVESRMAKITGARLGREHLLLDYSVESPAYLRLSSRLFGAGHHSHTRPYTGILLIIQLAIVLLAIAVPVTKMIGLPGEAIITIILLYLPANLLSLYVVIRAVSPGRRLLRDALADAVEPEGVPPVPLEERMGPTIQAWLKRAAVPLAESPTSRPLWSYLITPRTVDHAFKVLVVAVCLCVGRLALGTDQVFTARTAWLAAITVVVFEYLVYQARYTWNDLRGLHDDALHPNARERRRIPWPLSRARLRLLWWSIPLKLTAALLLVRFLLPERTTVFVWATVAVWVVAVAYEWFRDASGMAASGATVGDALGRRGRALGWGVLLTVGFGYCIRAVVGLSVGSEGRASTETLATFGVLLFVFEVSTVAMGWVLEGEKSRFRSADAITSVHPRLLVKPHLLLLMQQAGRVDPGTVIAESPEEVQVPDTTVATSTVESGPVLTQPGVPVITLWSLGGAVVLIVGAWVAATIAAGLQPPLAGTVLPLLLACVPVGLALFRPAWPAIGFLALAAGSAVILYRVVVQDSVALAVAAVGLWLLLAVVYEVTRRGDYDTLLAWLDDVLGIAKFVVAIVLSAAFLLWRFIRGGGSWHDVPDWMRVPAPTRRKGFFAARDDGKGRTR